MTATVIGAPGEVRVTTAVSHSYERTADLFAEGIGRKVQVLP
jgi:hypothetical protein